MGSRFYSIRARKNPGKGKDPSKGVIVAEFKGPNGKGYASQAAAVADAKVIGPKLSRELDLGTAHNLLVEAITHPKRQRGGPSRAKSHRQVTGSVISNPRFTGYQPQVLAIAAAAEADGRPGEFSYTPENKAVKQLIKRGLMKQVGKPERTGHGAPYATRIYATLTDAGRSAYLKRNPKRKSGGRTHKGVKITGKAGAYRALRKTFATIKDAKAFIDGYKAMKQNPFQHAAPTDPRSFAPSRIPKRR